VPEAILWRITRRRFALDRSGAGALRQGGRWNQPGTAVVYAGCSIAITALQSYVHLAGILPPDLVLVRIALPERHSAERPKTRHLPEGWDAVPPGPASRAFGTKWARERRSLALYLPSALVPEESIALLNPHHPGFEAVRFRIARAFRFDPRMSGVR
jgi:RES domain-containing protein